MQPVTWQQCTAFPKRWLSVQRGVRLLTTTATPVSSHLVVLRNRFSILELQDTDNVSQEHQEEDSISEPAVEARQPARCVCVKAGSGSIAIFSEHDLPHLEGRINGRRAVMLIDSGSTHDFISEALVQKYSLPTDKSENMLKVKLADGSTSSRPMQTLGSLNVVVKDFSDVQDFTVFPLSRYNVILGKLWLTQHNPEANYRTNEVTLRWLEQSILLQEVF
eukprot:scpid102427/ scgid14152/ 